MLTQVWHDADEIQPEFLFGRGAHLHHPWPGPLLVSTVQEEMMHLPRSEISCHSIRLGKSSPILSPSSNTSFVRLKFHSIFQDAANVVLYSAIRIVPLWGTHI